MLKENTKGIQSTMFDAIVIGAGQAGLATGYWLQRAGLDFTLLEQSAAPVGAWPRYYNSLTLFTPARFSALPGLPFPGLPDHYPTRDETSAYLQAYAARWRLPIRTDCAVQRVERRGDHFVIYATNETFTARSVIAATGTFGRPYTPPIAGLHEFRGRVLHAADYCDPTPFRDQRVVVVGAGNSAVQIGVELAQVARVSLGTRRPIRWVPQRILGKDVTALAHQFGVDRLPLGRLMPLHEYGGVIDTGAYQAAFRAARLERRPMFRRCTETGVAWPDGKEEVIDTVLFATGYRPDLAFLAPLKVLNERGRVRQRGGISTHVPGLYFVGMPAQRSISSATLRGVGPDARVVARRLLRFLEEHGAGARRSRRG